ncbi:hypothetical protein AKJ16_DCAP22718 [Drosera capensis]
MGKNQAYKAMQRARLGSSSAAPDEVEDGMVDGSFHTPEWHAARLANLNTSHTVTWEEFKRKQKEDELKKVELEADKERMMREYRAQLDAEREKKLAKGRNHASDKSKDRKDKDKTSKKRSSRKGKSYSVRDLQILAPPVMNPRAATRMNESPKDQSQDQGQDQGQNPRDRRRKESEGQEASIQVVTVNPKARYLSPGFSAASGADNLLKIPLWCFTIQRLLLVPSLNRLLDQNQETSSCIGTEY